MGFRICLLAMVLAPALCGAQDTTRQLQEVKVTDKKNNNFGHLYQVDGMKIAAGKKTEVIYVDKLTVNKATNNTRQVYAKVAGLNIFENDGSGLQLSIGGRGLDPNRTSNFNVRQNGYDISADALGYPESYYTPPAEALKRIEIIKGAASLQFGTQFGGLLNFEMKQPEDNGKPLVIESRQTAGSFGFLGSYNSVAGTRGKLSYFAYVHYKQGNGWRPNSRFESFNAYADLHYHLNEKHMIGIEFSHLNYLAKQPGGLDDAMFRDDPRQSNRSRNWFAVDWNLLDLEWAYQIAPRTKLQTRVFGLIASRNAIGFRDNRVSIIDPGGPRDLIKGSFRNLTLESRFLHSYTIGRKNMNLLVGVRAYKGYSEARQGNVNNGAGPDFSFGQNEADELTSDYRYPNYNYSAFAEQIIRINDQWNITPGIRVEHIRTEADGRYFQRIYDQRDSLVFTKENAEKKSRPRSFVIGGVGSSYKFKNGMELYGNISQNYRSVTFNDIRLTNASFEIDPDITDEKGWSADLGLRGGIKDKIRFDVSVFQLYYGNRIGEVDAPKGAYVIRRRGNLGAARIMGLESLIEADLLKLMGRTADSWSSTIYSNLALTHSEWLESPRPDVIGKQLEYVPAVNWKGGLQLGYRQFKLTYQVSHLSDQFTDASNSVAALPSAVNGLVPAYTLMDLSLGWSWRWLSVEGSVNNLANVKYFTRRATGYPGPGIIPGEGRSFYLTVGFKSL